MRRLQEVKEAYDPCNVF
ncbi:BBE domain-containing protein, partial [Anaerospora hongkongensis]